MKYSKNYIFIWLDKYEENSRVRYFVKKCVKYGHMATPYESWSTINRVLSSPLAIPWNKMSQIEDGKLARLPCTIIVCVAT